jgi:hypothetical protein
MIPGVVSLRIYHEGQEDYEDKDSRIECRDTKCPPAFLFFLVKFHQGGWMRLGRTLTRLG